MAAKTDLTLSFGTMTQTYASLAQIVETSTSTLDANVKEYQKSQAELDESRRRLKHPTDPKYQLLKLPTEDEMRATGNGYVRVYDNILHDLVRVQLMVRTLQIVFVTTPEQTEYEARLKLSDSQKYDGLQVNVVLSKGRLEKLEGSQKLLSEIYQTFKKSLDEYCQLVANKGQPLSLISMAGYKLSSYNIPVVVVPKSADDGKDDGKRESPQPTAGQPAAGAKNSGKLKASYADTTKGNGAP